MICLCFGWRATQAVGIRWSNRNAWTGSSQVDAVVAVSILISRFRTVYQWGAHTTVVHATLSELGPAGFQAARSTVIGLVMVVAMGRFDDVKLCLTPVLVQAAKDIAERHLTDPELAAVAGQSRDNPRRFRRGSSRNTSPAGVDGAPPRDGM